MDIPPVDAKVLLENTRLEYATIRAHMVNIWNKLEAQTFEHTELVNSIKHMMDYLLKQDLKMTAIESRINEITIVLNHFWSFDKHDHPTQKPIKQEEHQ